MSADQTKRPPENQKRLPQESSNKDMQTRIMQFINIKSTIKKMSTEIQSDPRNYFCFEPQKRSAT